MFLSFRFCFLLSNRTITLRQKKTFTNVTNFALPHLMRIDGFAVTDALATVRQVGKIGGKFLFATVETDGWRRTDCGFDAGFGAATCDLSTNIAREVCRIMRRAQFSFSYVVCAMYECRLRILPIQTAIADCTWAATNRCLRFWCALVPSVLCLLLKLVCTLNELPLL